VDLDRLPGRDERPLVAAEQTRVGRLAGLRLPLGCLVALAGGEVEVVFLGDDVGPTEVLAYRALELLNAVAVTGELDEHVAVRPVRGAAMLSCSLCECDRVGIADPPACA
jgi:hypothetical protein